MLTVILLGAGAIVVLGAIYMVFASGKQSGRSGQSSNAEATKQMQNSNPRGDVRSSGSGND